MSDTGHEQRRDALAAYLLGALEPGEAAELERHLAGCEACREELEWLRPAVQLLPESVERVEPSPQLRTRLMEQVHDEAAPPRTSFGDARGWRWPTLRPLAGLAAVALIAVGVAIYATGENGSTGGGETTISSGRAPGVTAQMVRDGETGTLHLANLRQLPPDQVLQAWVQHGERVVSAKTLFVPNRDGTATATIERMGGATAVMVTAEPRGGSVQPSSKPIVNLAIPPA